MSHSSVQLISSGKHRAYAVYGKSMRYLGPNQTNLSGSVFDQDSWHAAGCPWGKELKEYLLERKRTLSVVSI